MTTYPKSSTRKLDAGVRDIGLGKQKQDVESMCIHVTQETMHAISPSSYQVVWVISV